MKEKYAIEIYYSGSTESVWVSFTSDTPFQAISKGDIINPGMFPDANADAMLRVTSIEHIFSTDEKRQSKHKICIYTENIEDAQEARYGFDPE
jgi:hypothetical protein